MRVAVVIERFAAGAGGVERVAFEQVRELARRDLQLSVVCRRASVRPAAGVELLELRSPSFWQPLRIAAFSRAAGRRTETGFDVVHSLSRTRYQHIYRAGGGSHRAYMERVYDRPLWRARLSPRHRTILALEEAVLRDSSQIIQCNARLGADELRTRYSLPAERLVTIYNGVDLDSFHPQHRASRGKQIRAELGIEGPLALVVGSGFARKGLDRAIRGLAHSQVDAALLVVGRGDVSAYRKLARDCGVERRVIFAGPRDDMPDVYAAADLLVLPTRYDPFANVCLEAMAAGVGVATTRENGAAELVEVGLNGWLGRDDFSGAFELLRDPRALEAMGKAARRTAERYTWARHVNELMALYERVRS